MAPHVGTQPPLRATGFIQGDNDTLIPIYQPEALTQYMSGTPQGAPVPSRHNPSPQPPPSHAQAGSATATNSQPMQIWQPYHQMHMPMYPYVYHPSHMVPHPSQMAVNSGHPGHTYNGWLPAPAQTSYPVAPTSREQGSQSHPPPHPPQLHPTPPPYGIPTPPVTATSQAPPRLPPPSPHYPSVQQSHAPQNATKRFSRREGFVGHGGRPGGFNNRSLSQGHRPGPRRSPERTQGHQWKPAIHG